MTKQDKRRGSLIKRGYFLSEATAWSGFDPKDAPWFKQLKRDRTKLLKTWAWRHHVDLENITPEQLRKSLSYQRAVRKWYDEHGWVKKRTRYGKTTYNIDPYAAMRKYSDEYQKGPDGRDYMPPWRKRDHTRKDRTHAIDQRFSTAQGLRLI